MIITLPTFVRRAPCPMGRILRLTGWALLLGALSLPRPLFGQAPPPAAAPGIAAEAAVTATPTPIPEIVPLNEDPNDPSASQDERLERQRKLILKKINEHTAAMKRTGAQPTPTPGPTPAPTPAPHKKKAESAEKHGAYVILYLNPPDLALRTHQRFSTQCHIANEDHLAVDRIDLALSYPSQSIKLVGIHQNRLQSMLEGPPECQVDETAGTISYRARLAHPVAAIDFELLTFVWEAIAPTEEANIRPLIGSRYSQVFGGHKLLSSGLLGKDEALLGTVLRISEPESATPQGNRYIDLGNQQLRLAGFKDQRKLSPPRLWIRQPEKGVIQPGQWMVVDLGVDNPDGVVFDEVRLAAAFDPDAVEIRDSDRGNWISSGVNLLDGPFHKDWPWDNLYQNTVEPGRGYFYYRMGMNDLREQPSGTIARVFVRVRRPIQAPIFTWIWSEARDPGVPATGLYLFGSNIYNRLLKNVPDDIAGPNKKSMLTAQGAPGDDTEKADPAVYRGMTRP